MPPRADRSYYETWLRRTRRQLSASGRLTQVAQVLCTETGETATFWSARLRDLLEGAANPTLEELIRIEGLLATPHPPPQREPVLVFEDLSENPLFCPTTKRPPTNGSL